MPVVIECRYGPVSKSSLKSFLRFILVGLLNTVVGYGVFAAFVLVGINPELALLLATVIGLFFNFFTTGQIVFGHSNPSRLVRFIAVYSVVYLFNAFGLRGLASFDVNALVGQALLLPLTTSTTFLALRAFVFQEKHS